MVRKLKIIFQVPIFCEERQKTMILWRFSMKIMGFYMRITVCGSVKKGTDAVPIPFSEEAYRILTFNQSVSTPLAVHAYFKEVNSIGQLAYVQSILCQIIGLP